MRIEEMHIVNYADNTFFIPSHLACEIENALSSQYPLGELFMLSDLVTNGGGFVVKNRYTGITAPFDRAVTRWECVKALLTGYISIRS